MIQEVEDAKVSVPSTCHLLACAWISKFDRDTGQSTSSHSSSVSDGGKKIGFANSIIFVQSFQDSSASKINTAKIG